MRDRGREKRERWREVEYGRREKTNSDREESYWQSYNEYKREREQMRVI